MKQKLFFENARLLNSLSITPLMYGSLGLEHLTGENLDSEDIDILIPEIFLSVLWNDFKTFMEDHGYFLIDEKEHTFCKDGVFYSYASIEELESFADIYISDIKVISFEGAWFRILSLRQYLMVYLASEKDGYRINVRQKKDSQKIKFIKEQLHE